MLINVYIDHNVWHFLFERQLDLAIELPRGEFCLYITREAEFEIAAMPPEKADLKAFIKATITRCGIRVDSFFGFNDPSLPADEQRVEGFDVGRWASPEELAFLAHLRAAPTASKKRKTKLYKDEADRSLAVRSIHSVVLSLDIKSGPLKDAHQRGGKVVFLTSFDKSVMSLSDFIKAASP